jgi:acetoacetyl-CoA synthetase
METVPNKLWQPTSEDISKARIEDYRNWMEKRCEARFPTYHDLWDYSVNQVEDFWKSITEYFDVQFHDLPGSILAGGQMPDVKWFEGSTLNYAEHVFRNYSKEYPAILFKNENAPIREISWAEMRDQVSRLRSYFRSQGVGPGDAVVGFISNIPEATFAFLAACSLGAIWSSCSPDFGAASVVDRFAQIEPKVLFAADGYTYNGKPFDRMGEVQTLIDQIPSLQRVIIVPFLNEAIDVSHNRKMYLYSDVVSISSELLRFTPVPFSHPIWVLYSSGTTGNPKAITHSHGGVLLEHLKYLAFHNDVHPGERFFWYSTTGWMMWNFVQASLLVGATIVLYEGSPAYPDLNALWAFAAEAKINHFGTSAPFIIACMKKELQPGEQFDLSALRSIGSTGAPLPSDGFKWIYESIKPDVWLCSMSGGTDVCTAFVGGCPVLPVYEGEIQCRALGASVYAYDDTGAQIEDQVGEMVITKPMTCMPIYFWNDPDMIRYKSSYFEMFPGIWRHGDWIRITPRNGLVIYGRSDATLNRHGVRIGTAEIYRAVDLVPQIQDSIIINLEKTDGSHYMPLFVVMKEGAPLTAVIEDKIKSVLKSEYSPRHVPDDIIVCPEIPFTISGKKMEAPLKRILMGMDTEKAINRDAMRNPGAIDFFIRFYQDRLA